VKIGIISDRPLFTHALHRAISVQPSYHVIWIAENGADAVTRFLADTPDVALLALPCDAMDGLETTRAIVDRALCPVLIVTDSLRTSASVVLDAMQAGARDVVDMPARGHVSLEQQASALLEKLETIAHARRSGDGRTDRRFASGASGAGDAAAAGCEVLIAIGASAGGPPALASVLKSLPHDLGAGIVIVQHVDDMFVPGMAAWLAEQCGREVVVAKEGDRISPERVLVAGAAGHLVVTAAGRVGYSSEPSDCAYRPSVDRFFQSASRHWRGDVVGVLLTGMGKDGARGLKALRDRGHHTIAQNQATCAVYGMPKAAAALDAAIDVLPLDRIAARLGEIVGDTSSRLIS
jgi:two-component system response regulator WspF